MSDWRDHPWARGREAMLAAMEPDERTAWLAERDAEDQLYLAWRRQWEPNYALP